MKEITELSTLDCGNKLQSRPKGVCTVDHSNTHIYACKARNTVNVAKGSSIMQHLHVYAIYRAGPSDGYSRCEPARRTLNTQRLSRPNTDSSHTVNLKSFSGRRDTE